MRHSVSLLAFPHINSFIALPQSWDVVPARAPMLAVTQLMVCDPVLLRRVIYDINNITSIINNTVTQYNNLVSLYQVARPCLLNLTSQLMTINSTTVVLPSNVNVRLSWVPQAL